MPKLKPKPKPYYSAVITQRQPLLTREALIDQPHAFRPCIKWLGRKYYTARGYYENVILKLPLSKTDYMHNYDLGLEDHIWAAGLLSPSGYWYGEGELSGVDAQEFYVDNWEISYDLSHKHPELSFWDAVDKKISVPCWKLLKDQCCLCGARIPGEIKMMHRMYQL